MDGDFHLGDWLIEPRLNAVSRNGSTVHLQPKIMQVLVCLADHAGNLSPRKNFSGRYGRARLSPTTC